MKKNSIQNILKDPENHNTALTPCLKDKCDKWRDGECIQIRKAGKPDKLQLFSIEAYNIG